jgi:hypothetical protein
LGRIINHGVTPQQDGLRTLLSPARNRHSWYRGLRQKQSLVIEHIPGPQREYRTKFALPIEASSTFDGWLKMREATVSGFPALFNDRWSSTL